MKITNKPFVSTLCVTIDKYSNKSPIEVSIHPKYSEHSCFSLSIKNANELIEVLKDAVEKAQNLPEEPENSDE